MARKDRLIWVEEDELKKLDAKADELKALKAERKKDQKEIERLKNEKEKDQKEIEELKEEKEKDQREIEELKEEKEKDQKEIKDLKEEKEKDQKEIKELKDEKEKDQREIEELKGEKEKDQREIEELKEEEEKDRKEIEELKGEKERWKSYGDLHQRATCEERHQKNEANKGLRKLQKEYDSLNKGLGELQEEYDSLRKSYQGLQNDIEWHTTKLAGWTDGLEDLSQHLYQVPSTYIKTCAGDSIENPKAKAREASAAIARYLFNWRQLHKPELPLPIVGNVSAASDSQPLGNSEHVKFSVFRAVMESAASFEKFIPQEEHDLFYDDLSSIFTKAEAIWSDIRQHEYQIVVNDEVPNQLEEGWNQESRFQEHGGIDRICFFPKVLIYSKKHSATFCGRCYIP